ncbi:MAG: hypothetical protein ABI649_02050 [Gaiellaceae bacterium]
MKPTILRILGVAALGVSAFLAATASPAGAFPIPGDTGGHDHVAGTLADTERCGSYVRGPDGTGFQLDPATYDFERPSPLGVGALAAPDNHWVQVSGDEFLVVDLGSPADVIDLFPSIDHGPVPDEALESTVYGSNDLSQPESDWEAGDITTVFEQGRDAAWISDDFATRWSFSTGYRYVGVHWGGPKALLADEDAEIDAVCTPNRAPECLQLIAGNILWPPNHKYRLVTVSGATDPNGDTLGYTVTGVTQDEALDGAADGHTKPDAAWASRSDQVKVRAERSGRGNGRVYRIAVEVSDGELSCTGTALLGVPHDRRKHRAPVDSGLVVDSFGP